MTNITMDTYDGLYESEHGVTFIEEFEAKTVSEAIEVFKNDYKDCRGADVYISCFSADGTETDLSKLFTLAVA